MPYLPLCCPVILNEPFTTVVLFFSCLLTYAPNSHHPFPNCFLTTFIPSLISDRLPAPFNSVPHHSLLVFIITVLAPVYH